MNMNINQNNEDKNINRMAIVNGQGAKMNTAENQYNPIPNHHIGDFVRTKKGFSVGIDKIERKNGMIFYNDVLTESDLADDSSSADSLEVEVYATERFSDGKITLSTKYFHGNQYCRPISLKHLKLN